MIIAIVEKGKEPQGGPREVAVGMALLAQRDLEDGEEDESKEVHVQTHKDDRPRQLHHTIITRLAKMVSMGCE